MYNDLFLHGGLRTDINNFETVQAQQAEGENSKDSTDSLLSNSSSVKSRVSRTRNKPQAEEEPLPARETRRKTMMERVGLYRLSAYCVLSTLLEMLFINCRLSLSV